MSTTIYKTANHTVHRWCGPDKGDGASPSMWSVYDHHISGDIVVTFTDAQFRDMLAKVGAELLTEVRRA